MIQREITNSDIGSVLFWGVVAAIIGATFVWLWLAA